MVSRVVVNIIEKQSKHIFVNIHIDHSLTVLLVGNITWITASNSSCSTSTDVASTISSIEYSVFDPNPNIAWSTLIEKGVKNWIIAAISQIKYCFSKQTYSYSRNNSFNIVDNCFKYKAGRLDSVPACILIAIAITLDKPVEVTGKNDVEMFRTRCLQLIPIDDACNGTNVDDDGDDDDGDYDDGDDDGDNNSNDGGDKSSLLKGKDAVDLAVLVHGLTFELAPIVDNGITPTLLMLTKTCKISYDECIMVKESFNNIIRFNDSDVTDYEDNDAA